MTGAVVELAVLIEGPTPDDRRDRQRAHKGHRAINAVGKDQGVRVQKKQEGAPCIARGQVVSGSKPKIDAGLEQLNLWKALCNRLGGGVLRLIIDNNHFESDIMCLLKDRFDARERQLAGVIRDDQDREIHGGAVQERKRGSALILDAGRRFPCARARCFEP